MITRRKLLTGASALAASALALPAEALTPNQRAALFGGGARAFNPVTDFLAGTNGFLADDISPSGGYVFQDAALTTPCTVDGDPLGGLKDHPNANNFTQTGNQRPTIRNVSGKWRGRGDGFDDGMFGTWKPGTAATLIMALAPSVSAGTGQYIVAGCSGGYCFISIANSGKVQCGWAGNSGIASSDTRDIRGSRAVAALRGNASTVKFDVLFADGSLVSNTPIAATGSAPTTNALALGAYNNGGSLAYSFYGDFTGMGVSAFRDDTNTYAAMRWLMSQFA